MTNRWRRGVLGLALAAGAAAAASCGGESMQQPVSTEQVANTQSASLRIEGMT